MITSLTLLWYRVECELELSQSLARRGRRDQMHSVSIGHRCTLPQVHGNLFWRLGHEWKRYKEWFNRLELRAYLCQPSILNLISLIFLDYCTYIVWQAGDLFGMKNSINAEHINHQIRSMNEIMFRRNALNVLYIMTPGKLCTRCESLMFQRYLFRTWKVSLEYSRSNGLVRPCEFISATNTCGPYVTGKIHVSNLLIDCEWNSSWKTISQKQGHR